MKTHRQFSILIFFTILIPAFVMLTCVPATALTLVPTGLNPGDTYQLAFVTSGISPAMSSDIDYYNEFVQTSAVTAGLTMINGQSVTWYAIVSTDTVNARDNAIVSTAVYNINDQILATDTSNMWNGGLDHFLNYTEYGDTAEYIWVWTGTQADGTAKYPLGNYTANIGAAHSMDSQWIDSTTDAFYHNLHLYALSTPLTVPGAIPEPSTMLLLGLGVIGLAGATRRKLKR